MQPSSKRLLLIAGLLGLILAAYLFFTQPGPSDREQILAQIESARDAATHHNASEIMQIISGEYNDMQGLNNDRLHMLLIQALKNAGPIQVIVSPPNVTVNGNNGTSTLHIQVVNSEHNTEFERNAVLTWKREDSHRYLVIPSHVWRVVSADYGGDLPLGE